jgi:putative hydroxymethylpyrimidine transport system permease protein
VILALCMIISPRLQRWLMPLVLTSQAIPVFALPRCWCCGSVLA